MNASSVPKNPAADNNLKKPIVTAPVPTAVKKPRPQVSFQQITEETKAATTATAAATVSVKRNKLAAAFMQAAN